VHEQRDRVSTRDNGEGDRGSMLGRMELYLGRPNVGFVEVVLNYRMTDRSL